jgi:hypothetical protein
VKLIIKTGSTYTQGEFMLESRDQRIEVSTLEAFVAWLESQPAEWFAIEQYKDQEFEVIK